jgi:hypothetical protein
MAESQVVHLDEINRQAKKPLINWRKIPSADRFARDMGTITKARAPYFRILTGRSLTLRIAQS